jgi:hypothetical protein
VALLVGQRALAVAPAGQQFSVLAVALAAALALVVTLGVADEGLGITLVVIQA